MENNIHLRDKSHQEQIERWARYVRDNSNWKEKLKPFLDGQIIMARRAYKTLSETKDGKRRIKLIKKLRN
ncbi:hypothetical protein A3K82_00740 [Candidatus Pacearchaeota archaeon RBG_19FT_COMBO_34_9]|nr:MAG: hypothetical protein A3K82_00740 [Candidatus Pacearchaeota archaeon RBG_19FT_COMBO_34_9]OGJ16305.1 MAG: hypothetical protein A3K74_02105 [Candidatus Pacearchaeota archaeon RBG_13_33_26]